MKYILWVKPKKHKEYVEGYERDTLEEIEYLKTQMDGFMGYNLQNLDFKIEKEYLK